MEVRDYDPGDSDAVVALSLRAWAPVFASLEGVLGGLFARLHPDWRADQERAVREACAEPGMRVWVAQTAGAVAGFAAARLDRSADLGELYMIAVDPAHQRRGAASLLTDRALSWMRENGVRTAMVEAGGDPGHEPARRAYEKAGFVPLPVVRYFREP